MLVRGAVRLQQTDAYTHTLVPGTSAAGMWRRHGALAKGEVRAYLHWHSSEGVVDGVQKLADCSEPGVVLDELRSLPDSLARMADAIGRPLHVRLRPFIAARLIHDEANKDAPSRLHGREVR